MADNLAVTAGSGTTIAADDVGGVLYQRVKFVVGDDGAAADISDARPMPVVGRTKVITASFTRPNDTTAYTAGDTVANATSGAALIDFANAARVSGGSGVITGITVALSTAASPRADLELWIFDSSVTAINDNAPFAPSDSEVEKVVGVFRLGGAPVSTSGAINCFYQMTGLAHGYQCVGGTSLYGILSVRNAYTPVALEKYTIRLQLLQD